MKKENNNQLRKKQLSEDDLHELMKGINEGSNLNESIDLDSVQPTEDSINENEEVDRITKIASKMKVGDKTTFGVITKMGKDYAEFKAKDTPKTKIKFNQRKSGGRYVLSLLALAEENLTEGTDLYSKKGITITKFSLGKGKGSGYQVSMPGFGSRGKKDNYVQMKHADLRNLLAIRSDKSFDLNDLLANEETDLKETTEEVINESVPHRNFRNDSLVDAAAQILNRSQTED